MAAPRPHSMQNVPCLSVLSDFIYSVVVPTPPTIVSFVPTTNATRYRVVRYQVPRNRRSLCVRCSFFCGVDCRVPTPSRNFFFLFLSTLPVFRSKSCRAVRCVRDPWPKAFGRLFQYTINCLFSSVVRIVVAVHSSSFSRVIFPRPYTKCVQCGRGMFYCFICVGCSIAVV